MDINWTEIRHYVAIRCYTEWFSKECLGVWVSRKREAVREQEMAPNSSTLTWKIPWMEEPGGLQSAEGQTRLSDFTFTFHFHTLEKEMAPYSSVLAWRIPGTEEPGGLLSVGSHRVGHN